MKMFSKILSIAFLVGGVLTAFSSCSSDENMSSTMQESKDGLHTVTMKLVGEREDYDATSKSRADESAVQWTDGDKLYLQFTVEGKLVSGNAIYSATNNAWTVSYYGSITSGASTKCQAYYFEGASETNGVIALSDRNPIYEDANGSYLYDGETLTVKANLKPKTGRMRFAGQKGTPVILLGISHYTTYDVSTNSFSAKTTAVKDTVDATTGYTPYIYGYFSDSETPDIKMVINSEEGYTMKCPTSMYKAGESGYLDIPTAASHNGWSTGLDFTVNGVDFKMIPVAYKDGNFLIGETEVTVGLYNAAYADKNGDITSKYPVSNVSYSNAKAFISSLNSLTGLTFRLPSASEWMYAYKGGMKSLGYTYSGSNDVNEVAWYSGNSEGKKQEVKQKLPNELGIYDMSGNVAEWTSELYSTSYSSYYYYYGGSFSKNDNSYLDGTKSTKAYSSSYENYIGFRLVLTL